jgi:hypothetical protein
VFDSSLEPSAIEDHVRDVQAAARAPDDRYDAADPPGVGHRQFEYFLLSCVYCCRLLFDRAQPGDRAQAAGDGFAHLIERLARAERPAAGPTAHSEDFTMVRWFGVEYSFSLGLQASAVAALWREWEKNGLGLHQETIRHAIDEERDTFRMDATFRNHPAFGVMIRPCGDGRYRLTPPDAATGPPARKARKRK